MPDDKLPSINDWDDSKELPSVDDFLKEEVEEESKQKGPSTVNNALFVGSTADLQKLLKNGLPKDSK